MDKKKIISEIAYFKKVVKNMDNLDLKREIIRENFEETSSEIEYFACAVDEYFHGGLLDWIEMVENADLYKALKKLSAEEQILLSYVFYKEKTQTELAKIYGIAQQNISKNITKTLNKIKRFLFKK